MALNDDLGKAKKNLKDIEGSIEDMNSSINENYEAWKSVVDEIKGAKGALNDNNRLISTSVDISRKLRDHQHDINILSEKELKSIQEKLKSKKQDLKSQQSLLEQQKQALIEENKQSSTSYEQRKKNRDLIGAINKSLEVNNNLLKEGEGLYDQEINKAEELLQKEKQINKAMGMTGATLKSMAKIPIIGPLLKTEEAAKAAEKAARDGAGRWKTMSVAMKSMGKGLMESLSDPLVTIGLLYKGFKAFLDLGFRVDTEVTNLSKSMAVSKDEAKGVRDRFVEIQNEGKNVYETSKNLTAAQLELADATGVTRGFTEQQVRDQVLLTKNMKLSSEEAAGIQQFMLSSGRSAKDVTKDVIKQTSALAKQSGIQLDNKKILGEVAKTSGQLRLQYANNPALIAKAVVQTQKLGVSLEQAKKAAQGLLNFEQSIEDELSAELMLGKDLNLEKARQLALNGDAAGAMEEIARQTGSAADFAKMNVLQQESLAKAVGMEADELADSLIKRENLAKLGDETRAQIEEQIELARAAGDQDKVNMLERSLGNEEEAQAALDRISAQDKFNEGIEKLKIMLGDFLAGPAQKVAEWLGSLLEHTTLLKGIFIAISSIIGVRMVAGFVAAIARAATLLGIQTATAAAATATNAAVTFGVGTVAVIASVAAILGALAGATMMKDGVIDSKGGVVVSGEKGSIQLDKDDSIIAGTNLFGKNKKGSGGGGGSQDLTPLITEIRALASRPVQVSIDGTKVIEATTGKNPNVDSDTMNKNSNKIQ